LKIDLAVTIGKIKFKNPVLVASGTFGYGEEYAQFFDLNKLGGIITKSITLKPRAGNLPPRTCETPAGMLNAIGLTNVGLDKFIEEKIPFLKKLKTNVIVNIAGNNPDEYLQIVEKLNRQNFIKMLEVNISCPNVKEGGLAFGSNVHCAFEITKEVKLLSRFPIMVKLTPNVTNIVEIAQAVEDAGADAISLINTLVGMAIDSKTKKPLLGNITGGLSGPAIKPVALAMVYKVAQAVKIPIVGIGGIMKVEDALEFILAGASLVQIGTGNFVDPLCSVKIVEGLEKYCQDNKLKKITNLVGKLEIPRK
jgi:dihydroorotate dehydrogenase (NAD+) catalytic subunit